jgi:hypothetical protein
MKKIILFYVSIIFGISVTCCQEEIYLDEYSDYHSVVNKYSKEFDKESLDSIQSMIDEFNFDRAKLSCVFCVAEGVLKGEILDYCRNNHKATINCRQLFSRRRGIFKVYISDNV